MGTTGTCTGSRGKGRLSLLTYKGPERSETGVLFLCLLLGVGLERSKLLEDAMGGQRPWEVRGHSRRQLGAGSSVVFQLLLFWTGSL